MVGCPRAAAAVTGCMVQEDRWIVLHLAVRAHFQYSRQVSGFSQLVQRSPLWPASWWPVLDKSRGSKSAEVQRVSGVYDDRLQFMARDDAFNLGEALRDGDVSCAWSVWSSAAEAALADAYQFACGPVPDGGLVLGTGSFLIRTVRLGGPKVRKARRNFADPQEGSDVFVYHDASTALLLDLRRRFKAVVDVLHAMLRDGITLARSLELTARWDKILRIKPIHPLTFQNLELARRGRWSW